jgi:hypothetical protein
VQLATDEEGQAAVLRRYDPECDALVSAAFDSLFGVGTGRSQESTARYKAMVAKAALSGAVVAELAAAAPVARVAALAAAAVEATVVQRPRQRRHQGRSLSPRRQP